jgi:hypothetical protein
MVLIGTYIHNSNPPYLPGMNNIKDFCGNPFSDRVKLTLKVFDAIIK